MSVLVVGSVALDSVKTPFGEVDDALGGSASYFATAARRFAPVSLVAVVGEDFPSQHRDLLAGQKIDLAGLETAPGRTFRWAGEYGYDLNTRKTLDTQLNVFADFAPSLPTGYRESEYVFLANIHPQLQSGVLDQVKDPKMVVMDTMNFWIEGSREALEATIRRVDVLLLNDEETRMLAREPNLVRAAREILDLGPSLIIVKKGEHGALVMSKEFMFSAPAYPIESVFDPTGAGDTFAGGFLGYLAECGDCWAEDHLRRATIYGTVLASFTVEAFSLNRLTQVTRDEIEVRYREMKHFSRF